MNMAFYNTTLLPGGKKGISGSVIGGFNLSISKYIDDKRRKDAIKVLEYITSREIQKKYVMQSRILSGILSLYSDEDVCLIKNCEFYNSIQFTGRPTNTTENYDGYSEKFREYIYEFLYGNKTSTEVLKKIDDITRIYYVSMNPKESKLGFINVIISSIIMVIMLSSLIFIFKDNVSSFLRLLPDGFWILIVSGSVFLLLSCFAVTGKLNSTKCNLKLILCIFGLSLNFLPILIKLVIYFPIDNRLSKYVSRHKYLSLLILICIDLILFNICMIKPFTIEKQVDNNGRNYYKCSYNTYHMLTYGLIFVYKLITFLIILLLIFIEWNIKVIHHDLKFIVLSIYIMFISIITYIIAYFIKYDDYITIFFLWEFIIYITSISNYLLLYGHKIIFILLHKKNGKLDFITNINKHFIENESEVQKTNGYVTGIYSQSDTNTNTNTNNNTRIIFNEMGSNESNNSNKSSLFSKLINYHYIRDSRFDNVNSELSINSNCE